MKKEDICRIAVILIILILVIGSLVIIDYFNKLESQKEYEYYTFEGNSGISNSCTSKNRLECKIKGKMVEVQQFSERD